MVNNNDNNNDLMKEIEFLKKRVKFLERRSGEQRELIRSLVENLEAYVDQLILRIKK